MKSSSSVGGLFKKVDTWLLVLLAIMGIVFFYDTFSYRAAAALFPRIVSIVVAALSLYQLGENVWGAMKGRLPTGRKQKAQAPAAIAWYWVVLVMLAYFLLIPIVGFNLATVAFMIAFPPLVGYRRWVVSIPFALVITAVVAYCFGSILHIQMPIGLLGSAMGW